MMGGRGLGTFLLDFLTLQSSYETLGSLWGVWSRISNALGSRGELDHHVIAAVRGKACLLRWRLNGNCDPFPVPNRRFPVPRRGPQRAPRNA
jgi:hypothetical protein